MWSPDNPLFKNQNVQLQVEEGDNLIFLCPELVELPLLLYWTYNQTAHNLCDTAGNGTTYPLLTCKRQKRTSDFILKISRFSELTHIPTFHPANAVYFFAQHFYCEQRGMRIAVRLKNNNRTSNLSTSVDSTVKRSTSHIVLKAKTLLKPLSETGRQDHTSRVTYRIFLLPGVLALLTLLGMQLVICAFWIPPSFIRRMSNCFRHANHMEKGDDNCTDSRERYTSNQLVDNVHRMPEQYMCLDTEVLEQTNEVAHSQMSTCHSVCASVKHSFHGDIHYTCGQQPQQYYTQLHKADCIRMSSRYDEDSHMGLMQHNHFQTISAESDRSTGAIKPQVSLLPFEYTHTSTVDSNKQTSVRFVC